MLSFFLQKVWVEGKRAHLGTFYAAAVCAANQAITL